MRRLRIYYFTTMPVLFLAARLTGRRELFLLLFMMAFVVVYSVALGLWTFLSFSFLQEVSERTAVKSQTLRLKIGVYNGKPFPFNMMRIKVETALPSENIVLSFNLSPQSHIYYDLPLYCAYRGMHKVGMTTLEVNDIFGLIRINYDMRKLPYYRQRELIIFPRLTVLPFLTARMRDTKLTGGGAGGFANSGDSYAGLRQYRPGDSLGRLHWPASIRTQDLFVKHYDRPVENSALVALDNSPAFVGEDALRYADLACECAASIANYGLHTGFAVQVVSADIGQPAMEVRSHAEFKNFYKLLAHLTFGKDGDIAANIRKQVRANGVPRAVYALAAHQDEELFLVLTELARSGSSVKCFFLSPNSPYGNPASNNMSLMPGVSCHNLYFGGDVASALNREDAL